MLFWLAVGAVLVLTLRPMGLVPDDRVNLVPLAGIVDEWHNANVRLGLINNLGNIGVFVPIGLLGVPATGRRPWQVIAAAGALSVVIEILQHWLGRSSDVDDVILNTLGAAVGVALFVAARALSRRRVSSRS